MQNVLVVEDDPAVASQIARLLENEGFRPLLAGTGRTAMSFVADGHPELVLLDLMLPDCDGFQLCKLLRENPITSHVPIIMLTAKTHTADKVEGLTIGADDYVAKPFHGDELIARIRTHLRRYAQERAVNPLTQLPGNLDIDRRIEEMIAREDTFAVVYVDLDNFKSYNDYYGFTRGDEVLLFVAEVLHHVASMNGRASRDLVGHVGGDDFIIVTDPDMMEHYCKSIIRGFDEGIGAYYDEEDLRRGHITSTDRRGTVHTFPVMTVSVAVVTNERRPISSRLEVGEIAAQLKHVAKAVPRSSYHVDQRQTPLKT